MISSELLTLFSVALETLAGLLYSTLLCLTLHCVLFPHMAPGVETHSAVIHPLQDEHSAATGFKMSRIFSLGPELDTYRYYSVLCIYHWHSLCMCGDNNMSVM